MSVSKIAGIAVATFITVTPVAFAQTKSSDTTITTQTFTGCLMTETAYRKAHNLDKITQGDIAGIGLGNEYVLVDVTVSPAKGTDAASMAQSSDTPAASASTSATTCADKGVAYRLSGKAETNSNLKGLLGRQVEVQGRFQHAADAAAGGTRPGHDVPAEIEIDSFREAPAPVAVSEPAPPPPPPPTRATATAPATVEPTRAPAAAPATTEPRELPRTASSSGVLALIGVLALGAGVALTVSRRRRAI